MTSERIAELDSLHATEAPFLGCGLCDDGQPAETADRTGLGGLCVGRRDRRETRDHRSPYFFFMEKGDPHQTADVHESEDRVKENQFIRPGLELVPK